MARSTQKTSTDRPNVTAAAPSTAPRRNRNGLPWKRYFTRPGVAPFDEVQWETREASITNEKGEVVFEQHEVEIPTTWSQVATNVVVSKYFRGVLGTPERERSVKQLIGRVVRTIHGWANKQGYFSTPEAAEIFRDELTHLLVHQKAAFNSPVWFNAGIEQRPQLSACFINKIEDRMESILTLAKTEGMLFKYGSGTGSNLSPLRSSRELLAGGGTASGPVSFMKGFDAFAGVIKSGGKTRRAAKMVILNVDHPDIVEFINCKVEEERKAWTLIEGGYDSSFNGPAYSSIFFQNSNNSVRVKDDFMKAVEEDSDWHTFAITTGQIMDTYKARDLMRMMADAAWACGDPGLQYDTTVNNWHTSPNTDRINASNPCSEYMFLDDTSCNLASINLMKFLDERGEFDVEAYREACRLLITAQEILVDNASYPTEAITKNSRDFRPLGLGYANLGALLMASGLPYDSDAGRDVAAALTAVMTGEAYAQSARIAQKKGPFNGLAVYRETQVSEILQYIDENDTIEGAPHLRPDDLAVFDCAFKPAKGSRTIHYIGHVKMMAAAQPFISGAISKTVIMPENATPEDIMEVYLEGWRMGLKAIAIYRDGSKRSQPLNTALDSTKGAAAAAARETAVPAEPARAVRRKLPDERRAITHKFDIQGHEGYITVGIYEDGTPGEIFLVMSKEGSTISGLMDAFATAISLALQYGVPLEVLVKKFAHTRFEPSGFTKNPEIPIAKSITDYIFRWLASKFLDGTQQEAIGIVRREPVVEIEASAAASPAPIKPAPVNTSPIKISFQGQEDAPACSDCGSIMIRNGTCYKCLNCGSTSGCS